MAILDDFFWRVEVIALKSLIKILCNFLSKLDFQNISLQSVKISLIIQKWTTNFNAQLQFDLIFLGWLKLF